MHGIEPSLMRMKPRQAGLSASGLADKIGKTSTDMLTGGICTRTSEQETTGSLRSQVTTCSLLILGSLLLVSGFAGSCECRVMNAANSVMSLQCLHHCKRKKQRSNKVEPVSFLTTWQTRARAVCSRFTAQVTVSLMECDNMVVPTTYPVAWRTPAEEALVEQAYSSCAEQASGTRRRRAQAPW